MRRVALLASLLAVPLAAVACAQGSTGGELGMGAGATGGTSGTGGSSGTGGATSGGTVPTSCAQAGGYAGCCSGDTFYYCKGDAGVTPKNCTNGQTCGWDTTKGYYGCVTPPGLADPSGAHPLACQ
jgi:hypothetical protein